MKLTCFARPPKFKNRLVMVIIGVLLQGFGLSLLIKLNLGTDPCSCLTQGVIRFVPISFGTAQLLCHLVTFLFVIRFDMSLIGFGTIGNMVFLGYIADFWGWVWDNTVPEGFFQQAGVRYGLLIPVLAVFILGASTYMTAGLGTSPYDGLPFIISNHVKKLSFKAVRMIWDISFMVVGFLLGGDVGIVTAAVAFFLGPVITWVGKKLQRFIR
ncbi:MAG: hypothetical protein NC123_12435 [Butyrivibrio sp.]|nr:hypothetical protein [Acetatifactor muris]MCM1560330.1 hypothetical protein [Butyrivibrio sp.]